MSPTIRQTGRLVPEADWAVILFDHLFHVVQRLWCWREFSLPVVAIVIAAAAHDPDLALTMALVSVICAVLLLLTRPRMIASAFKRCRTRSRALSTQIAWPGTCEHLGWSRRLPSGGRLVPALLGWVEDEYQVRILVRPLPEHGPRAWDQMADALRRMVGGETVQWRESRGTLAVVISRHGLPGRLAWGSGLSDRERIVLGQRHGGALLALDILRAPHVLLAGATGSGKGGAIRSALAGALEAGWQAMVLDPKESGEYHWVDHLGVPVFSSVGEQLCALEVIEGVRERRQGAIKQRGVDNWHQLPPETRAGWRPLLVVVDEAADLLVPVKGRSAPQKEYAAIQQQAAALVAQLARKGRSAGIHLVVAIQRPDTAQLGDGGGALRNNLTARLALASLDGEGLRMLGIPSSDPIATTLDGTPGRAICVGFGGDPRPSSCQVAWLEQQRAIADIKPAVPQGLAALEPGRESEAQTREDEPA